MFNLFDLIRQAQGGHGIDQLARQFGLSADQTRAAIDALLPAFGMGLERQARNPDVLTQLFGQMARGAYAPFYDADGDGIPDSAAARGNDVLGMLFGSKDLSRAVAQQAAAATGIGTEIMKQMLPVIAAMLMGGLGRAAQPGGQGGSLAEIWSRMAGGMFGGTQPGAAPSSGGTGNPFGDMMNAMLGGMMGAAKPAEPPPPPNPMQAGLDAWNQMVETGSQAQAEHLRNLQKVFEAFTGGGSGERA